MRRCGAGGVELIDHLLRPAKKDFVPPVRVPLLGHCNGTRYVQATSNLHPVALVISADLMRAARRRSQRVAAHPKMFNQPMSRPLHATRAVPAAAPVTACHSAFGWDAVYARDVPRP